MTKTGLEWRKDFPMLGHKVHSRPLIYLDSAATAQKPASVIDAVTQFYNAQYGTVHRALYQLSAEATAQYQQVREKVRAFINAKAVEEIIFTRGTTESINLVATCFGKAFVQAGDELLITEMEHHSNIVPWQMLCTELGATLKVVPVDESGQLCMDKLKELLTPRTKLVAVTHVSNVLGTLNPIHEICSAAHAMGAKVLVDGAQSTPHLPIDVQALDVDFFVFSGHKLYGPTGIGVLYGKRELLETMPPYQGGGDMVEIVTLEESTYRGLPLKFEAGTPMIAGVIGLGAAIDYLNVIGMEAIHSWEQQLLAQASAALAELPGLRIIGNAPQKGALISFVVEGSHSLDVGTLLDVHGIAVRTGFHCAQPIHRRYGLKGTSRCSFGLYNTPDEISRFVDALKSVLTQLR